MADTTITITFTEAQWARVVAASNHIKGGWEIGPISSTIDANYLSTHWKNEISAIVKNYEKAKRQLTISKIIQHRQDNPFDTLQEIGEAFGFTRQYIYKVLKKNNMPTLRVKKRKVNYCLACNEPILVGNSKIHKGKCRFSYYNIKIECGFCKIPFYKKRYRDSIYCSMSCFKKANSEKALSK